MGSLTDDGKTDNLKGGQSTGQRAPEIQKPGDAQFQGLPKVVISMSFRWLFDPLWDRTYLYADEPIVPP